MFNKACPNCGAREISLNKCAYCQTPVSYAYAVSYAPLLVSHMSYPQYQQQMSNLNIYPGQVIALDRNSLLGLYQKKQF